MQKRHSNNDIDHMIYIAHVEGVGYPLSVDSFSPSTHYPEYRFESIAEQNNIVYDMVRDTLRGLNLDAEHYGTPEWNPLGKIIREDYHVLIKPNLVRHANRVGGIECLVTSPAVLRPIIDYVLIALNNTGKITIGDAPVQSCDFDRLLKDGGYQRLIDFYRSRGIDIAFEDFRGTVSHFDARGNLIQMVQEDKIRKAVRVDLQEESAFACTDHNEKLRVTNYPHSGLMKYHDSAKHEYLISQSVLEVDVIINVPKPKTHRKAGITGALKNMVGIIVDKNCLPHHTQGSKEEGGDEYDRKSAVKRLRSIFYDKRDESTQAGRFLSAKGYNDAAMVLSVWNKFVKRDINNISEGNWHGNDTIWRTVVDLNRIVRYADRKGIIQSNCTRSMLTIADMITAGEQDGPLSPSPNPMGMIVAGFDSAETDRVIATLMGIDYRKIPCIFQSLLRLPSPSRHKGCRTESNDVSLAFESIDQIDPALFRHVIMPRGWETV